MTEMTELDAARGVRDGKLPSPYRIDNSSLFDIRITGTGAAYRSGLKEFVWRDPAMYLNEEFLARCNGLPVIVEHPPGSSLDSKEFAERIIGTVMLPYIKDDEIWAIARIFDDAAIEMMTEQQLSTSPAVVFRDPDVNDMETLDDGSTLLREGVPSLLDHIAIVTNGVWDKSADPSGINVSTGVIPMSEEEMAADRARKDAEEKAREDKAREDAEAGEKLDKILKCVDALGEHVGSLAKRMDAYEAKVDKRKDEAETETEAEAKAKEKAEPRELAADKAKKDAEAMIEAKARKDAEEREEIRRKIADLDAKLPKQISDADYDAMAEMQARADRIHSAFGDSAPRPLQGETPLAYQRRLINGLKKHSSAWKDIDMSALPHEALKIAEATIYADAMNAARNPTDLAPGVLREVVKTDPVTGQRIITFVGSESFIGGFKAPTRRVTGKFNISAGAGA
jgi:hypothetical protein